MPRPRFTVRWLMAAVAVVGLVFGLAVSLVRVLRMPRDAVEALAYVARDTDACHGCDDVTVRKLRPGQVVKGQGGALFEVICIWKDEGGAVVFRRRILIMEGGYRLRMAD